MRRLLALVALASLFSAASGCALCCAPFDGDYPYIGGRWVRHNPSSGRVGSAFDEAGGPVEAAPPAQSGEPTPAAPPPAAERSVIPSDLGETYLPTSP